MWKEFKEFAMKGNMIDLAVGVIIGAAFGKVMTSFVADVLMPPLGLLLGKVNFSNLFINLSGQSFATLKEAEAAAAPVIKYGLFINNIIDFLLVAFAIFIVVKQINKLKKQEETAPDTKECPHCLSKVPIKASRCAFCTSELK